MQSFWTTGFWTVFKTENTSVPAAGRALFAEYRKHPFSGQRFSEFSLELLIFFSSSRDRGGRVGLENCFPNPEEKHP
jgi:hypothetical protein